MPLCAAFQLFDAIAAMCNGILRGIGRQEIGGYVGLFSYYVVAVPLSLGLSFGLHWGLWGLWGKSLPFYLTYEIMLMFVSVGPAVALGLVAAIELYFIFSADWERSVADAKQRNTAS